MPKLSIRSDFTPRLAFRGGTLVKSVCDAADDADAEAGCHLAAMTRD